MFRRLSRAAEQLTNLAHEVQLMNRRGWWRWGGVWFSDTFIAIAAYRLNRSAYLALGPAWSAAHVALAPLRLAASPWTPRCEIHYEADIGRGLRLLHPSLGIVVSGKTVAGKNLVLTGGNCIGSRKPLKDGDIRLGDDVMLGANAVVLGPVTLGNGVRVGAGALVVRDAADGETLTAPVARTREPVAS